MSSSLPRQTERGLASGCSWWPTKFGWQWSAYGPNGGESGPATTEAEASLRAKDAERRLRRGVGSIIREVSADA